MSDTSALPNVNMDDLFGTPVASPIPESPLEKALAKVTPEDAMATVETKEAVKFQFRDLLDQKQLADLKRNAPALSEKMMKDYSSIIRFGEPVLVKMNDSSIQILDAQRNVSVPEADVIVNDLLRSVDGYSAKYRNPKIENGIDKFFNFIKGVSYSLVTMAREAKPIIDKIEIAETKLREMELKLEDNVRRGQELHTIVTKTLQEVAVILAALEETIDVTKAEALVLDELVKKVNASSQPITSVEYKGRTISSNELQTLHSVYATGVSEMEKTWFDWRQQFFLGYAQAPSVLNIALVSATMQRRCYVFRMMGLPSARTSLGMWQQAALAREGAKMGKDVQEGTDKLIQGAFEATGQAVTEVAMASQAPIVSEETVWVVLNSIKTQCEGLVAADKWGRDQRARNLHAMEQGEAGIRKSFTDSRSQLVQNALETARQPVANAPEIEADVLKQIGVQI